MDADRERRRNFGFLPPSGIGITSEQEYNFLGQRFLKGEGFSIRTKARDRDVTENLIQVREASRQADWVLVSLHYHQMGGTTFFNCAGRY